MRYIGLIIVVLVLIAGIYSCKGQNKTEDGNNIKRISKELIEVVYKNEQIDKYRFDSKSFFHCKLIQLNENHYLAKVALNQFKASDNYCFILKINGVEAFVYSEECKKNGNVGLEKNDPFFVSGSFMLNFLVEYRGGEIFINKLSPYYDNSKKIKEVKFNH